MKKIVLSLIVLIGIQANAGAKYEYIGKLHVEKPMEFKEKSKTKFALEKGVYNAAADIQLTYGFWGTARYLFHYQIQTSAGIVADTIKFEKKSHTQPEKQNFTVTDATKTVDKLGEEIFKETRVCTVYSFTTQENCRAETEYACTGTNIGHCNGEWVPVSKVVCDTVHHELMGEHEVTLKKGITTVSRKLLFKDKKDQSLVASLIVEPFDVKIEKKISETKCR